MPPRLREADALAAVAWAAAQPWAAGAPVLLGWSHGGTTVLRAWARAPAGALSAAIAFYPGCGGFSPGSAWAANATAPLLMQLGAADDWTPPGPCLRLAAGAGPRVTATAYPGAHHGFDAPGETLRAFTLPDGRSVTAGGQPAAREAAQAAVAAFLARHAAGP
jgi:dienelactone hydrolase